ncbi:MAG: hypothetical protein IPL77_06990 [Flavobacteriales bacterium]|nr:hypothetical protein [Flavobacteriales bacterium]
MMYRTLLPLLFILPIPTFAQTVIFTEDFDSGTAASLATAGWTWTGNAPIFTNGDQTSFGVGKESKDLSTPPLPNPWDTPILFHPLPYDPVVLYTFSASLRVDNPLGTTVAANIGFGWFHPTNGLSFGGQSTSSETWIYVTDLPYLQSGNPGYPGAQFGLILAINPSATGAHAYFDNIVVTTQPNLAMFMGRVFLEGPYQTLNGQMSNALASLPTFPLTESFTALGYPQVGGGGGETTTAAVMAAGFVDWIRLELRSPNDPTVLVATRQALVAKNGTVYAADGQWHAFFGVGPGNYYVAVRHRDHLGVMSAAPVYIPNAGAGGMYNDFASASYATWGTNARKTIGSVRALWAGDANGDGTLKYAGSNNDRDRILVAIGGSVPTATVSGYRREDLNMDGIVKYAGSGNDRDLLLSNIGGSTPTNTRTQQLP